ncbi:unnamed protein product [Calypogeia fissa]
MQALLTVVKHTSFYTTDFPTQIFQEAHGNQKFGELETFYNALITESDYAESIGLLQAVNLDEYLAGLPAQIITVFLPINYAYYTIPVTTIDLIYRTDQVQPVAEFHVVKGYYNSTEL